jgi:hypothetical protein
LPIDRVSAAADPDEPDASAPEDEPEGAAVLAPDEPDVAPDDAVAALVVAVAAGLLLEPEQAVNPARAITATAGTRNRPRIQ